MRLMEVGTKQQSMNNKDEANRLFNQAYDLYCLFWGLNMNLIDTKDVKWIEDKSEKVSKITEELTAKKETVSEKEAEPLTGFAKMKAFIRNAVNCCIE